MKPKTSLKPRGDGMALLVIDVQLGLFQKSTPIYRANALLANINKLIECARLAGVSVIYAQHCNDSFLKKDTPGWQLHPELLPPSVDELRIYKRHGSSFKDTPLEQELLTRRVGALTVTGLVTQGCVRSACLDASAMGYRTILVADGHSNFSKDAARLIDEWNVRLQQAGVQVIPATEIDFIAEITTA